MADIRVPEFGESILEGTVSQWLKQEGDSVSAGEVIVEIETEKVNAEVSAEQSGVLRTIHKQIGEVVLVGEVIAYLEEGIVPAASLVDEGLRVGEVVKANNPILAATTPVPMNDEADGAGQEGEIALITSPSARKRARERGENLQQVSVQQSEHLKIQHAHVQSAAQPTMKQAALPSSNHALSTAEKPTERIPMSRRRQTIARRLVEVQQQTAMLTTFNEIDMTAVLDLRKRRKDDFYDKFDVKLGFMSFFTKAVVGALKQFPMLNAELDGNDIVVKKHYDIGVAVSTEEGLVVPVVQDADRLSFAEIEREITDLADKARNRKLTLDHLRGGTFTITNGGIFGSLLSTPILNAPQVGILGMHTIQIRPVAIDAERMENRSMMYIALSYDHRVVDGQAAVSFLVRVKQLLEDPESLLLEG